MTHTIVYDGREIVFSTDVDTLRDCFEKGVPGIMVLCSDNQYEDTSFVRFAVDMESFLKIAGKDEVNTKFNIEYNSGNSTQDDAHGNVCDNAMEKSASAEEILGRDFLNRVLARTDGTPAEIMTTDRLRIRELSPEDLDDIIRIYADAGEWIEPFFEDEQDGLEYLKSYIGNIYDLYGFGLWGICLKNELQGRIIGIAGLTARDSDGPEGISLELGYAVGADNRKKGYCYEACETIMQYAADNLEYDEIFARVLCDNIPGLQLAKKLQQQYDLTIYTI